MPDPIAPPRLELKALAWVAAALLLMIAAYPVVAALGAGYGWQRSDWNGDGRTTLREWFWGRDVGSRVIVVDGRNCTEYFDLKAAHVVRIDCPARG